MGHRHTKTVYVPSPPPPPVVHTVVKEVRVEVPAPPPPPTPMFDEPWRRICWENYEDILEKVTEYKPEHDEVQHLRFLLYGPVGAGKSSFVNSVTSALIGRMAIPASVNTSETATKSFTVQYKTHRIKKGRGKEKTYYPFVFNDIMGLEGGDNVGVRAEDIKLAMKGHVKEGYKFNPKSSLTANDPHYNPEPRADDKVHVLVCLLNANTSDIDPSVIEKMKEIREAARDLGIPQVAIGTHIDGLCDEIEKNIKNVYKSKELKAKMAEFSNTVGIPLNCIMAVKNYCEGDMEKNEDMDTLILTALRHIINFGDDFIEEM